MTPVGRVPSGKLGLALHEADEDGNDAYWGEKVSDEEYFAGRPGERAA